MYGVRDLLHGKRVARGWSAARNDALAASVDDDVVVRQLVLFRGGETGNEVFPSALPWETQK